MVYLLILPICLYAVLAAVALIPKSRGLTSTVLALYIFCATAATAGYLVLGTTGDRRVAEMAGVIIVLASGLTYAALLPLTILGLYAQPWLQRHRRRLLVVTLAGVPPLELALIGLSRLPDRPIVYQIDTHAWVHWLIAVAADSPFLSIVMVLGSQVMVWLALGWTIRQRRLTLWDGAVPLVMVSMLSILLSFLAPLGGRDGMIPIAALNYMPPVIMFSVLIMRPARATPFETLITSLQQTYNEHFIILDARQRVLWHNLHTAPWSDVPPLAVRTLPHVLTLLDGSDLQRPVKRLLDDGLDAHEVEIDHRGEQFVVKIVMDPFEHAPYAHPAPVNSLLRFQDVTTARVRRNLLERSRELTALSAISTDIASSLDVEQVIQRALQHIPEITGATGAAVFLTDPLTPGQFKLAGKWIAADNPVPLSFHVDTLTPDDPIYRVLVNRELVVIASPDQLADSTECFRSMGMQAGAIIPLLARGRITGLLVASSTKPHEFNAIEVALFESIGRQLAVAIDNARLHTEEREQRRVAEALREAAGTLTSKTLDQALSQLLSLLREIVNYDRATVLLHAEPGTLRIGAFAGFEDNPDPAEIDRVRIEIDALPYLKRLFADNTPVRVADTTLDPDWVKGSFDYESWIGAPLTSHDRVLGCLSLAHHEVGHFTETDLQTTSAFASQVAIVTENAQLLETEQQRRAHAELMQQASYALVTSSDLDGALQTSLDDLARMLQFDQAHIGLISDDGEAWTYHAGYPPISPDAGNDLIKPISHFPLMHQLITHKQPLLVPETRDNPLWKPGQLCDREIRCWMGAPLMVRDRIIGVVNIDSFQPYTFTDDHLQSVQVFANQIAAALDNFRLVEQTRRQNRALRALNTVLAASNEALTRDNMLGVMLERVLEALGLSAGTIHHYQASARELQLRAASGLPEAAVEQLRTLRMQLEFSSHSLPHAALTSHTLPAVTLPDGTPCEWLSVPLVSQGVEIGLLSLAQTDRTPIASDLHALLTQIGQQLGVVMDNATLFEDTSRRVLLSTDIGRLSLAISTQLDRDAVLNLICRECISIFDVQGAYVWLIEQEQLVGIVAYGPGADQFRGQSLGLDQTQLLPAYAIKEWRPFYINHIADTAALPADFLRITGAQSAIAVPLLRADVPVGTMLLVNTENPAAFSDWLLEQIGLLGVQVALAIQNATLFDAVRRRLDQLRLVNETGRYTTAILSQQSLIEGVAQKLSDILHYDIVCLVQVDDKTLSANSIFIEGQTRPIDHITDLKTPFEQDLKQTMIDIAAQAVQQAEPIVSSRPFDLEVSALAVPLIVADEVIGVLIVARRSVRSITEEDLDVLEPLAAQLAISVSNARLFEKVRQQAVELEARVAQRTAEIRQQQKRTEAILRSVADAVIVFDLSGQVVMTNPAARRLFDAHDLDMDLGTRVGQLVARALDNGQADSSNLRGQSLASDGLPMPANTGPDATDIIELGRVVLQAKAARVVEDNEVLGSVVILRDISQLRELDRMKDVFVSNVSHELRTPLANLRLYLSLLKRGRPERRADYLDVMDREIHRLSRLIDDLLQISRLESERRDERPQTRVVVHLESVIDSVVQQNAARAENQHKELLCEYETYPLPPILGDVDQLIRALTNLVSNAINYTPEGGRVTIRSRVAQTHPESVIIEVIDTGIGIPKQDLPTIFERFRRGSNVSAATPGTGLGLAIIKEIIELHHGTIEVESEESQGSLFRLSLPLPASNQPLEG
jgi:GAF domain-containing protein/two-component sensor histidine kinase